MQIFGSFFFSLIFSQAFSQNLPADTLAKQIDSTATAVSGGDRHTGIYLIIITIIVGGINWLVTWLSRQKGKAHLNITDTGLKRLRGSSGILLLIAAVGSQVYEYWHMPYMLLIITGITLIGALIFILTLHLRIPDWLFRNRSIYSALFFYVLIVGVTTATLSILSPKFAWEPLWILPFVLITTILFVFQYLIGKKKWKRLKGETPYAGEQNRTISAEAGLLHTVEEEESRSNTGRILLFDDHLVFVAKDGGVTPIRFDSIKDIHIHREWRIIPAGLKITDHSGRISYLAVHLPYYWRKKAQSTALN